MQTKDIGKIILAVGAGSVIVYVLLAWIGASAFYTGGGAILLSLGLVALVLGAVLFLASEKKWRNKR